MTPGAGGGADTAQWRVRKTYRGFAVVFAILLYLSIGVACAAMMSGDGITETAAWVSVETVHSAALGVLLAAALIALSAVTADTVRHDRLARCRVLARVGAWLAVAATVGALVTATISAQRLPVAHWLVYIPGAGLWPALTWWFAARLQRTLREALPCCSSR